ncbi:response regulator [Ramlibacter rhizophilus]|uniref:histidine kinase n=1 Tax=Ramlibacter rhizophilus TaxID=1781167 RepID=A0A4Z0BQX4_9BURK|nr:response regulator [Ramlibacter rhizophilus]TFZ01172.1 response regulator [Ramlibacter rhizophilus]
MVLDLFRRFDAALRDCANASARTMLVASSVGAAIFIFYGVLWLYVTPVEHESLALRSVAVLLCLSVSFSAYWPRRLKPVLPWVWFAAVLYALPFYATYQLLGSDYSVLRSMLVVSMAFFVIVIFPHYVLALVNIALGVALGVLAGYLTIPNFTSLHHEIVKSVHLQAMVYSVTAGLLFTRSNLKGILARQRIDTLKDLAGSIAHELRNPLGQLRHQLERINRNLPRPVLDGQDVIMTAQELDTVYKELAQGRAAIERGLQMIAMTLDEIHAKPLDTSDLRYLSAESATRKAVEEFAYESASDRARVTLRVEQDFVFRGDETRYIFVLFNLLKNAIHYFKDFPQSRVTIVVGPDSVVVEDTGPGMKPEVLARVFESFHTAGKTGGTGLGLSFCKRTMVAFGGDIACTSQAMRFTRFTLRFASASAAQLEGHRAQRLEQARALFAGKRLMVVDDSPVLRLSTRGMLEPLALQVVEAEDGEQALALLARERFDAMVLDLSMPVLDGYATAERIRAGQVPGLARLPIVVYTAEAAHIARAKLDRVGVEALVGKPCSQLELVESLCRAWEHAQRSAEADAAAVSLAGRTVLLVDDEDFNRRYLRALLEARRIRVLEATDGAAALKLLEREAADAVITDIHMPVLDGIRLARAVRESSRIDPKPVLIALSGRDDELAIAKARAAGISDFIAKPAEPDQLFATLAKHLVSLPPQGPAPAAPEPAGKDTAQEDLLNLEHLETLRSVGILGKALPMALQSTRSLLDQLQAPVASRDAVLAKELLHSLVGVSGNMGAHSLHQQTRAMYAQLVQDGQWPAEDWHEALVQLHARTARALREGYLEAA